MTRSSLGSCRPAVGPRARAVRPAYGNYVTRRYTVPKAKQGAAVQCQSVSQQSNIYVYMWTCADCSLLYTYLALAPGDAHSISTPPFPHPVAGSFSTRYTLPHRSLCRAERNDFLYPTPVWQMWTRAASPSRHEQSQRSCRSTDAPPLPALLCACDTV